MRLKDKRKPPALDRELTDLPPAVRWREWMLRVEAVIFAAPAPVPRERLARLVGTRCNLEALIADIRAELKPRPYDILELGGGFRHVSRPAVADAIRADGGAADQALELTPREQAILIAIAYHQPITRDEIARLVIGGEVSRDTIGYLRAAGLVAPGPRSPQPGAPYTYITTPQFLERFGLTSLAELPDLEKLEDAGLLGEPSQVPGLGKGTP